MNGTRIHTPQERQTVRLRSERNARRALVQLLCAMSILRTVLTRILPVGGCASWWVTLCCLLPGGLLFLLAQLGMNRMGVSTLTGFVRACLGQTGAWVLSGLLAALLLADGAASLTALITFFTEGVGTRGTQMTLSLLTGGVLLFCLNREGLPRSILLLRWVLLAGAAAAVITAIPAIRLDHLYPLRGDGGASVRQAFLSGAAVGWPLLLLLDEAEVRRPSLASSCPVVLGVLGALLFLCLTIPHEGLTAPAGLAERLLLPGRYASPAMRMLIQCLLMLGLFLAIAGAVLLWTMRLSAPMRRLPAWLPYAGLTVLTLTQALDVQSLWRFLSAAGSWLTLLLVILLCACAAISFIRRDAK